MNIDEWRDDAHPPDLVPVQVTVNHNVGKWARDAVDDGMRELHIRTMEGT